MRKIRQPKGKCSPIRITKDTQDHIKRYKQRLQEMSDYDEVDENEKEVIYIVLHKLTAYETNILCAYYDLADCSSSNLGKLLGISPSVAANRIKAINKKIRNLI